MRLFCLQACNSWPDRFYFSSFLASTLQPSCASALTWPPVGSTVMEDLR